MQKTELQETLSSNINRLMHTHNVSMRQLSSDIGCSDSYMQKIMSGDIIPPLEKLLKIAHRFNVPFQSLFEPNVLRSAKHREVDTYLLSFTDNELDAVLTLSKSIASNRP